MPFISGTERVNSSNRVHEFCIYSRITPAIEYFTEIFHLFIALVFTSTPKLSPTYCGVFVECGDFVAFDPTEGPPSVAEAKCRRVLALLDDTSLGVKQAYTNSLRG